MNHDREPKPEHSHTNPCPAADPCPAEEFGVPLPLPHEEVPAPPFMLAGQDLSFTRPPIDRLPAESSDGSSAGLEVHLEYDGYGNLVGETRVVVRQRIQFAGSEFDLEAVSPARCPCHRLPPPPGRWVSDEPPGLCTPDPALHRYLFTVADNEPGASSEN